MSHPASRGFSMIEVMVAMVVLTIGLLAMAPLVSMAVARGSHARKITAAQHLAQDLVERLRAEIRYDGGLTSNLPLSAGDEWKFDTLPHTPDLNPDPVDPGTPAECQRGSDDKIAYDYGPFEFVREDHVFTACYDLHAVVGAVPAVPAGTMEVRVRILWRNASGGWSSWALSDLLVSGA